MNPQNTSRLEGVVQEYQHHAGANWTRWTPKKRGQVRFWLGVSRELAGDGLDVLLCAIEPKDELELRHYQDEIRAGRTVLLQAGARSLAGEIPGESAPGVIFVAESCGFDGREALPVHQKPARATGKMAAAGDDTELNLKP